MSGPNSLMLFQNFHRRAVAAELQEAWGDVVPTFDNQWAGDADSLGIRGRYQRPATTLYDRSDGRFLPVYQTEFDLSVIRALGRTLAQVSPNLVGAVRNLCNYTIGGGFTFTAGRDDTATCTDEEAQPLIKAVQREINVLLDDIGFVGSFDREIHNSAIEDGEVLLHIKRNYMGKVRVYRLEPDQLRQPMSTRELEDWIEATYGTPCSQFVSSWSFGVHTRADEPGEPLGYHCVADESGVNWEYVPANRMVHIKRNVPRNAKRGFSDFYPVEPDSVRGEKLRRNMAEGAAVQSAIAFVRQHVQGTTRTGVENMLGDSKVGTNTQQLPGGGSKTRNVVQYRPGTVVDLSAGLEYKPGPMGSDRANDFMVVANYVQRTQAVRWSMPEYMFTGDASNANYSSTLVAESPFVKSCEAEQRFYSQHFKDMLWKALHLKWELGAFNAFGLSWEQIEQFIEINVQCPTVATRDPKARAETASLDIKAGILSPKTACEEAGYDWEVEKANGLTPETPAAAGAPGADGQPVPQAGGEHVGLNLQQIQRIGKATDSIVAAFRAKTMDEATARMRLDALGTPAEKIDKYLDADPNNDPPVEPAEEPAEEPVAESELIECGGEGGKPGPCPEGGGDSPGKGGKKGGGLSEKNKSSLDDFYSQVAAKKTAAAPPAKPAKTKAAKPAAAKPPAEVAKPAAAAPKAFKDMSPDEQNAALNAFQMQQFQTPLAATPASPPAVTTKTKPAKKAAMVTAPKPPPQAAASQSPSGEDGQHRTAARQRTPKEISSEGRALQGARKLEDPARGITKEKGKAAVEAYTSDVHYKNANQQLRNGGDISKVPPAPQMAELNHLAKQPLAKPTVTYRGITPEVFESHYAKLGAGGEIAAKGFVSTSLSPDIASEFSAGGGKTPVVLEIKAKTGMYVNDISKYPGEHEIVQAHGTRYRMVGIERNAQAGESRATIVRLEEI